jgi:hypothetical protein
MLHTQLAALALAASAVIASGCGSSKTETTTTTASATTASTAATTTPAVNTTPVKVTTGIPLSRTVWLSQGEAICASTAAKLATLSARTQAQLMRELPLAAAYDLVESEELSKLVPPKSMAHDWELIVTDLHLSSEYTNQAALYIKTTHNIDGPAYTKASHFNHEVAIIAKRDGFKQC